MVIIFPAVLVCGSPENSVLAGRLSRGLEARGIEHLLLDLGPQSVDTDPLVLEAARGQHWSVERAAETAAFVAQRHLPLLIAADGRTLLETAPVAARCNWMLLDAQSAARDYAAWRALAMACGLQLLADIHGDQELPDPIIDASSTWVIDRVAAVCTVDPEARYRAHLAMVDTELTLDLERPIFPLPAHPGGAWQPCELAQLLASLPAGEPIALYGAAPAWLIAALAAHALPAVCMLFDRRYGWVTPPQLAAAAHGDPRRLSWEYSAHDGAAIVHFTLPDIDVSPCDLDQALVAQAQPEMGLVIDGRRNVSQ